MQLFINDLAIELPSTLSEITLGQRIEFYNEHGKQLDEMLSSIMAIEDEFEKELELMEFTLEKMFRAFAFFTGTTVEALKESEFVDGIASIYQATLQPLLEDDLKLEPLPIFHWNGDIWELADYELKHGSKMQFGELIDAKQTVKDMMEQGAGKWEYMLPLCAIYLRKQGEEYDEAFLYEGSERLELMKSLPLDIAIQVGFFLSSIQSTYPTTFQYFRQAEPKELASIQKNTLLDMAGSTFSKALQLLKYLICLAAVVILSSVHVRQEPLMYWFMPVKRRS